MNHKIEYEKMVRNHKRCLRNMKLKECFECEHHYCCIVPEYIAEVELAIEKAVIAGVNVFEVK